MMSHSTDSRHYSRSNSSRRSDRLGIGMMRANDDEIQMGRMVSDSRPGFDIVDDDDHHHHHQLRSPSYASRSSSINSNGPHPPDYPQSSSNSSGHWRYRIERSRSDYLEQETLNEELQQTTVSRSNHHHHHHQTNPSITNNSRNLPTTRHLHPIQTQSLDTQQASQTPSIEILPTTPIKEQHPTHWRFPPNHHQEDQEDRNPEKYYDPNHLAPQDLNQIDLKNPNNIMNHHRLIHEQNFKKFINEDHVSNEIHSDTDLDGQSFDDYDWENDDDLDGDVRYEDLNEDKNKNNNHHRRKTLARRFSPYNILKVLITTFIGNILLCLIFILAPTLLRFLGYYETGDSQEAMDHRYLYDNISAWLFWTTYNLLSSWAIHFLIELGPRVFVSLVSIVWGDVNEGIKSQIETFHTAKLWIKAMLYSAMLWGSWEVIFRGIYRLHRNLDDGPLRAPYTETVYVIVRLFFVFMMVLSVEKLIVLNISMSFHRVAYCDRIQRVARALAAIDALQEYRPPKRRSSPLPGHHSRQASAEIFMRGLATAITSPLKKTPNSATGIPRFASPTPIQQNSNEPKQKKWWSFGRKQKVKMEDLEDKVIEDQKYNDIYPTQERQEKRVPPPLNLPKSHSTRFHEELGSSFNVQDGQSSPYRYPPTPTPQEMGEQTKLRRKNSQTTFAAIARRGASAARIARAAMKDPISVVGKKSGFGLDINNPSEARKLARRIYFGLKADPQRNYLIPSDFYPAFPNHEAARDAFSIFDSDGNGDVSRSEVKNEIFRVYKERRALSQSLKDVGHAIQKLDSILMALGAIVFLFIALAVIGIDFTKALTSIYTIGIAAAFIFKQTAGNVFDAIILVFCTHPFDTGDRILMDNKGVEEILVVKRMGLLATVFLRWDGTEWFAPNSLLGEKFIVNLRRSTNQFENATIQVGWETPLEKLDELEDRMNDWLQTDEERRFEPATACVIQKLVNQQYIEITLGMTHRENWQDWGGRWNRRTAFHAAINHYSRELGIRFYNSEQPIEISNWDELSKNLNIESLSIDQKMKKEVMIETEQIEESRFLGQEPNEEINSVMIEETSLLNQTRIDTLGFIPPEIGNGLRKRRKMSKKKAMLGDA